MNPKPSTLNPNQVETVAFPDALQPRAPVDAFDGDLRGGGRAPQDETEYVRREEVQAGGGDEAGAGGGGEAVQREAPRGGGREQVVGGKQREGAGEAQEGSQGALDAEAAEEAPGPLQSVATEIAIESRVRAPPPDIEQGSRAVAPTSSRGGLVLAWLA